MLDLRSKILMIKQKIFLIKFSLLLRQHLPNQVKELFLMDFSKPKSASKKLIRT